MRIRPFTKDDLDYAATCTLREGWASETREEFEIAFAHDSAGCLLAEIDGERAGIGVGTCYGEYGFIGELIVDPNRRGQGIGAALLEAIIKYLRSRGTKNILLDGVQKATPLYERTGFRKICPSLRFTGHPEGSSHRAVRPMMRDDFPEVCRLDMDAFGADRSQFLRRRLTLYPSLNKVMLKDGQISGYISGRHRPGLIAAGPWVARPDVEEPEALLLSLASEADEAIISLGILGSNRRATALVESLGFEQRATPPWRMLLGETAGLGASPACLAIGAAWKG